MCRCQYVKNIGYSGNSFFSRSSILILKIVSRMGDIFDILAPPRGFITHRYLHPQLLSIQDPFKIPSLAKGALLIVAWGPSTIQDPYREFITHRCVGPPSTVQEGKLIGTILRIIQPRKG